MVRQTLAVQVEACRRSFGLSEEVGVTKELGPKNAGWSFGGKVPETFVSHIAQSVPYYVEMHDLVCQLSDFYVGPDSVCYELGVSTGELLKKLALHHPSKPRVRWVGLDVEQAMTEQARLHCENVANIEIHHEDVRLADFERADLFVSYYCMQFVPPRDRQAVFQKVYDSLNWGGAFILFEKVRGPDARFQDILSALYNDFKVDRGLGAEEILAKTRSLKGVLEPFSTAGNLGLLERAGFKDVMGVFKYLCFEGFLAIK
jgi:tRNA (cmo5U34)-methyltransferase